MSLNAAQRVYDESRAAGLTNVMTETYNANNKDFLWPAARRWLGTALRMLVFGALLRSGEARDENEAKKRVEEVMEDMNCIVRTFRLLGALAWILRQPILFLRARNTLPRQRVTSGAN